MAKARFQIWRCRLLSVHCLRCQRATGKDYSAGFQYESEAQAELLVGREGDLVDFIGSILGKPVEQPEDGDPCVVELPIVGQVCGIKLTDYIVCLTTKGMARVPDRYLIAGWRA